MFRVFTLWVSFLGLSVCLLSFSDDKEMVDRQYLASFEDFAVSEMLAHGIPASITLAQALVESDAGRSILAVRANNHFGIKCKSWWTGNKYYYADDDLDTNGKLTASCFRFYGSAADSFRDHSEFLKLSDRYSSLFLLNFTDYTGWAQGLQECGYATDRKYAERLIRVIEKYRLYELDKVQNK